MNMLSIKGIEELLGVSTETAIAPEAMAKQLRITFFPYKKEEQSLQILNFVKLLEENLAELGADIIPYQDTIVYIPLGRRLKRVSKIILSNIRYVFRKIIGKETYHPFIDWHSIPGALRAKRIGRGTAVIAVGEHKEGNLPKDIVEHYADNTVVTIIDMPEGITKETGFQEHFNTSLNLFAYHMTNLIIGVNQTDWILYNFNASHPFYKVAKDMHKDLLFGLIPKIVAPIKPNKFKEFEVKSETFSITDEKYLPYINDLIESGKLFEGTGLYPKGKKLNELPFRTSFYKFIGKLHLDHRNGMSYGFLARQLPTHIPDLIPLKEIASEIQDLLSHNDVASYQNKTYILLSVNGKQMVLEQPTAWVLTQRSGSDKTNFNPQKDLIKMGILGGRMFLETPIGTKLTPDYKPSFDTKVILAHALGNIIIASVLKHKNKLSKFVTDFEKSGVSISHWHGYLNPDNIPSGWHVHGINNPHVSCSSPQSAVYALQGKLEILEKIITKNEEYLGDVHIEPHHGSNICFNSLVEFAQFVNQGGDSVVKMGNDYLGKYNSVVHTSEQ